LFEHCLYGVRVLCNLPLFDRPVPVSGFAPGEHAPLELRPLDDGCALASYQECIPLYSTHGREVVLHTDRELASSVPGQPWCLEVKGVVRFTWAGSEPVVYYRICDSGNWPLLVFWFVHMFLPLHLTLERGYDFIHAAAVEVDDEPILFVAPSTGGKSTLGDYFLKQGHPMLSDDKVATFLRQGQFYAVPSHPHHRPFRQFEVLGYPVAPFARRAGPIHAFYVLGPAEPEARIEITEVTGFRKFEELLPNYLYSFRFLREQRMNWLARLADQSPVFRVSRPWNLERMPEVYEAICAHSRNL
jgi:hypothetical protein